MGAPKGNEFWKLRKDMSEDGRKISIKDLIVQCQGYIDYCLSTPLIEIDYRGKDNREVRIPKMRAMSLWGLYTWLNISESTWKEWKKDPKYSRVVTRVENLIKAYKFEGAAAGLLNSNLIIRDLSLVDKQEQTQNGTTETRVVLQDGTTIEDLKEHLKPDEEQ